MQRRGDAFVHGATASCWGAHSGNPHARPRGCCCSIDAALEGAARTRKPAAITPPPHHLVVADACTCACLQVGGLSRLTQVVFKFPDLAERGRLIDCCRQRPPTMTERAAAGRTPFFSSSVGGDNDTLPNLLFIPADPCRWIIARAKRSLTV
jgi:hypothetical protein